MKTAVNTVHIKINSKINYMSWPQWIIVSFHIRKTKNSHIIKIVTNLRLLISPKLAACVNL